ncbi:MAG: hypothetical protein ACJ79R_20575 [Anaeromyxobacteraceae bacterium]
MAHVRQPTFAILLVGVEGPITKRDGAPDGQYLARFDPEAHGGDGYVEGTKDPSRALRFESWEAAFHCWQRQSVSKPLRGDGKPNRPLSAFTVEIVRLEAP